MATRLKVYIAGPMTNLPHFNREKFDEISKKFRDLGFEVFSPVDWDINEYGEELFTKNPTGCPKLAVQMGFNLRESLAADVAYICLEADMIVMLPGWENSKGAQAEWALARALGLEIRYES